MAPAIAAAPTPRPAGWRPCRGLGGNARTLEPLAAACLISNRRSPWDMPECMLQKPIAHSVLNGPRQGLPSPPRASHKPSEGQRPSFKTWVSKLAQMPP